ncbi:MAG: F0F1 ATP synthase subunit A [Roseburia sp.]|nr:F0F1 ATP synthase subunit A [Roseburia sp.]
MKEKVNGDKGSGDEQSLRKPDHKRFVVLAALVVLLVLLFVGILLTGSTGGKHESIKEVMKDAVLHGENKISFLGLTEVNPAFISAVTVNCVLLLGAACIRIFVIPGFRYVPGKFQLLLEQLVGMFDGLAKSNSPHRNKFLGTYLFGAGVYIFVGTLFELFGVQGVTTGGLSIALPAPLSDINAAIAMGCLSYGIILSGGIVGNGIRGVGSTLKDFSLPISMSFRLFGALLSGLLVTELVYYYLQLSFVLPVVVGVLFTLLHALIQTYVLTMLTALFYGEVSEPHEKKSGKKKNFKAVKTAE